MGEEQAPVFKGFGVEFTPPRWAWYAMATIIVIGLGMLVWLKAGIPIVQEQTGQTRLAEEMQHYQKHFGEKVLHEIAVLDGADTGRLTVGLYASDRCLVVTRSEAGKEGTVYHFFRETAYAGAPPGAIRHAATVGGTLGLAALVPAQGGCRGRCANPHAGQFRTWAGERRGTWVAVYRQYPDGCTHYQWYETTSGRWDVVNGVPQIRWTCCNH